MSGRERCKFSVQLSEPGDSLLDDLQSSMGFGVISQVQGPARLGRLAVVVEALERLLCLLVWHKDQVPS